MTWKRRLAWCLGVFSIGVYLGNTSRLAEPLADGPFLIAHRGLAQDFDRRGLDGKTCTAARMLDTGHQHLENTIDSMAAAFALGADVVELDIQRTTDRRFAVFHDWTLDCRTEGQGVTREHDLASLQALDVGYGYTADGGRTWPLRGRGVGLMPSLDEVFDAFPNRRLMLDIKSNDGREGELLADRLLQLPADRRHRITVHGGWRPIGVVQQRLPELRTVTRSKLKHCLKRYIAFGWAGRVATSCHDSLIMVPANIAPWLWGWPNRFLQRMDAVGSQVILIGDYGGEGFSSGFDDPAHLAALPDDFSAGLWTDRIDLLGPAFTARWPRAEGSPP